MSKTSVKVFLLHEPGCMQTAETRSRVVSSAKFLFTPGAKPFTCIIMQKPHCVDIKHSVQ